MRIAWPRREAIDLEALTRQAAAAAVAEYRAEQERAAESVRASLAEAQDLLQRQQGGSMLPGVYGGNGRSMYPGVFARDHPYHWSQPGWVTWRPGSLLTVDTLRQFAQRYDILRAMINYLKDHVATIPLQIVAKDAKDDSERMRRRIDAATAYFQHEGGLGGPGETREEFQGKLIEDLLVPGVGTVYLPTTRGGDLLDAVTLDSATIRPRVDLYGWPVEGAWYEQVIDGLPHRSFDRDQLYWKGLYPRNDSPYPDSPCEYLALTVLAAMSADTWNREWLTNGTEPGRMVGLPGDWTPAQAQAFIDYFLGMLSGNIQQRQQVFFVPSGMGTIQNPTRRDHDFQSFMEWLARRCSAIMGVQLAAIGFPQGQYATTQEKSMDQTADVGVSKLLTYLSALYCYLLERLGYPDLCAKFVTAQEEDATERADRVVKLVAGGIWSPNRARKELGDESEPAEGADSLWIPATLRPLEQAIAPPEPPMTPGSAPGNGNGNTARQPATDEQRRLALHRYEQFALRRLARSEALDAEFDTRHLDDEELTHLRAELSSCEDADAVRAVFTRAREMGLPRFNETYAGMQRRLIAETRWKARRLAAERGT